MEHKNYERELKYLITEVKLSFDELIHFLNSHGYKVVESRAKKKHEAYHDDEKLRIINRGDVLRSSQHFFSEAVYSKFMYKKDISEPNKPYVSKLEIGSGKYESIEEFIKALTKQDSSLDLSRVQLDPVLYAEMARDTAVVEKGISKLLISYDNVNYFKNKKSEPVNEKMIEIEDWTNPDSLANLGSGNDIALREANDLLLNGKLPIKLTKHSKPFRGYKVLSEKSTY